MFVHCAEQDAQKLEKMLDCTFRVIMRVGNDAKDISKTGASAHICTTCRVQEVRLALTLHMQPGKKAFSSKDTWCAPKPMETAFYAHAAAVGAASELAARWLTSYSSIELAIAFEAPACC